MRLGLSSAQTTQAAREIRTCLRRAGRPIDAFRLSRDTFAFHLRNRLSRPLDFAERQTYAIHIGGQVVDLQMRRGAGDMFVFHEVFTSQSYRLPAAMRARIRTVVDLGSNVGLTALYWLDTLPNVRVVCVEPAADNAAILRDNLAAFADRAVTIEGAITAHSGTTVLSEGGASWEHRVVSDGSPGRAVRSLTVDEVFQHSRFAQIDLLKIDIEGAEAALFDRVHPWMDAVSAMIVELHPPVSIERFVQTVEAAGFRYLPAASGSDHEMILAVRPAFLGG